MSKRVFIGIPCYQMVPPEVLQDYMRFTFYLGRRYQEYDFFLGIKTKSEQFRARNAIVKAACQVNADYVLMMDDDHIIDVLDSNGPSEAYEFLKKLIGHMEEDPELGLVGALYYHRGGECRPVLMHETDDGKFVYLRDDEVKHELQDVAVQGGGCMLIRMRVFDQIGYDPFEPEFEYGTDLQICRKVAKAGYKVKSDTSIEIGHMLTSRSTITGANRHQHYAETAGNADDAATSARMTKLHKEYSADIMEYLGITDYSELVNLANSYNEHNKKFDYYREIGELESYYRDSGPAYLARAIFIRNEQHKFDDFVFRTVRAGYPGVGIDFGCGAGPVGFELARQGQQIWFYDVNGSAPFEFLKWRAKKYNLYGTKAIFSSEWPEMGSVDYALCLDSLEHLKDWRPVIDRISDSLKEGGCLITNYMLLADVKNTEHINLDFPGFMAHTTKQKLWPLNTAIFQKRTSFVPTGGSPDE